MEEKKLFFYIKTVGMILSAIGGYVCLRVGIGICVNTFREIKNLFDFLVFSLGGIVVLWGVGFVGLFLILFMARYDDVDEEEDNDDASHFSTMQN